MCVPYCTSKVVLNPPAYPFASGWLSLVITVTRPLWEQV
jgi:hypothetical protein